VVVIDPAGGGSRCCAPARTASSTPATCRSRAGRVPHRRRRHRPRPLLPAGQPGRSRGRRGSGRRWSWPATAAPPPASPATCTSATSTSPAAGSPWSTSTTAAPPATAAPTASAWRASGGSSTSRTAWPPPATWPSAATSTRPLAIRGGSAGGYTTLCALTFTDDVRRRGQLLRGGRRGRPGRDTHKFESRYLDRLIGPWPEAEALYRERSPIHFTDRLSCR
jgi:hypothetical protein